MRGVAVLPTRALGIKGKRPYVRPTGIISPQLKRPEGPSFGS